MTQVSGRVSGLCMNEPSRHIQPRLLMNTGAFICTFDSLRRIPECAYARNGGVEPGQQTDRNDIVTK